MTKEQLKKLNKMYMPYVSLARLHGGPAMLQAIGPALLTMKWEQNSAELRKALINRFGQEVAFNAIKRAFDSFASSKTELQTILKERYEQIHSKPTSN